MDNNFGFSKATFVMSPARDVAAGVRSGLFSLPVEPMFGTEEVFRVGEPEEAPELEEGADPGIVDTLRESLRKRIIGCLGRTMLTMPDSLNIFAETGGKFCPGYMYRVVFWIGDDGNITFQPLRSVRSDRSILEG